MDNVNDGFVRYENSILRLQTYTSKMDILLVEDNEKLYTELLNVLKMLFKNVDGASNGVEALSLYEKNNYDLILSDISMPKLNGVELSKKVKQLNQKQEIIILSAHKDSEYLFELINTGVRRFIEKPVSFELLVDELYIVCKELYTQSDIKNTIVLSNNITYKLKEKMLYIDNNCVNLTKYEDKLLYILIKRVNQNVSTDEIVNEFYMDNIDIDTDNVRKQIYKLRKKLPKDLIQSIHGVGYRIKPH